MIWPEGGIKGEIGKEESGLNPPVHSLLPIALSEINPLDVDELSSVKYFQALWKQDLSLFTVKENKPHW